MTTIDEYRPRVRKGIALIEEHEAGATDRIDLGTLDLFSYSRCALAQAVGAGDYWTGRALLNVEADDDACAVYGFAITYAEQDDHLVNYANLREAWITELTEHRTAKAALVAD